MLKRKNLLLGIAMLLIVSAVTIFGVMRWRDNTKFATRTIDDSVDYNGISVDVNLKGVGSPTVLFEPGLNENYSTFYGIQEELSKQTRTFSYNRIAIAYANNGKKPRSTIAEVQDLHKLLAQLKVKPPYLLVAHSIAGYNVRIFAATYPEEVSGIVFIDCSHEDQSFRNVSDDPDYTELSLSELYTSQQQLREAREKDVLRNVPITVITAGYKGTSDYEFMSSYWTPLQKDLASLSNKSRHITIADSGHMIQSEHPDIVIREIKSMLRQINGN